MIKATIKDVGKGRIQDTGEEFLDVVFDLVEDDKVISTHRHGFALDTPAETIEAELAKFVTAFETDRSNAIRNAEVEARHAAADETIAKLTGKEVAAPTE